jgi:hypothetical protein
VFKEKKFSREFNLGENLTQIAGNINENQYIWRSAWKKLGYVKFHTGRGGGVV